MSTAIRPTHQTPSHSTYRQSYAVSNPVLPVALSPTSHPLSALYRAPNSASIHHAPVSTGRAFSRDALLLTAFMSAIGGASLAWLMMRGAMHDSQYQQAIAPVPAVFGNTLVPTSPVPNVATAMPVSVALPNKDDGSESKVRDLVEGWRLAWQRRDVEAYLRYYGPQFVPANGQIRADWNKARQKIYQVARRSAWTSRKCELSALVIIVSRSLFCRATHPVFTMNDCNTKRC